MAVRSRLGTPEVVEALHRAGADLENSAADGRTPAMVALRAGRTDLARALLAAGARAGAVDRHGDGLLNHAIYARRPDAVAAALDAGAPTDALRALFATPGYRHGGAGEGPGSGCGP